MDYEEKIFEVYREYIEDYIDKPTNKNLTSYNYNNVNYYE
jgi:hypothetical protein